MDMAKPKIRFKGYTDDWEQRKFGDLVEKYEDPIDTPTDGYMRLGIRSHAKGTFHSYVEKGKELETAKMFRVAANNFIVNITFGWEHAVAITDESDAGKLVSHRFPQYSFENGMIPMFFKYLILDENFKHHLELSSPGGAGRNRVLKLNDMLEYKMKFPCEDEQRKLASYFDDLDHLITLHQCKCHLLLKLLHNDWEQRKLGDVLISLQNNTFSRADLSNESGVAKNVHYGDVLIKFGEVLDVSKEQLPMILDESVLTKYKASFLQNGDVIVADTAEDSTVGKCSEIAGLNDEVILSGLHTIPYRPAEKFATGYLGYYLNSCAYHNQLIPLMQGIKVTSISKSAMQDTDIVYPKLMEEQTEIGNYFYALDHLITLHQQKNIYF